MGWNEVAIISVFLGFGLIGVFCFLRHWKDYTDCFDDTSPLQPPLTTPQDCARFEKWISSFPYYRSVARTPLEGGPQPYADPVVSLAWDAWQAAQEPYEVLQESQKDSPE